MVDIVSNWSRLQCCRSIEKKTLCSNVKLRHIAFLFLFFWFNCLFIFLDTQWSLHEFTIAAASIAFVKIGKYLPFFLRMPIPTSSVHHVVEKINTAHFFCCIHLRIGSFQHLPFLCWFVLTFDHHCFYWKHNLLCLYNLLIMLFLNEISYTF